MTEHPPSAAVRSPPAASQAVGGRVREAPFVTRSRLWDAHERITCLIRIADAYNDQRPPGLPALAVANLRALLDRITASIIELRDAP